MLSSLWALNTFSTLGALNTFSDLFSYICRDYIFMLSKVKKKKIFPFERKIIPCELKLNQHRAFLQMAELPRESGQARCGPLQPPYGCMLCPPPEPAASCCASPRNHSGNGFPQKLMPPPPPTRSLIFRQLRALHWGTTWPLLLLTLRRERRAEQGVLVNNRRADKLGMV